MVKNTPPADPVSLVLMPGEMGHDAFTPHSVNGVDLPPPRYALLHAMANHAGTCTEYRC
jgi:LDH2 family malate/lactate/ureidoglycolate dehydrogenase